ncbi:MAG: FAD-dependent oxidoreductase [Candidatus Acidiferrales bacterium]
MIQTADAVVIGAGIIGAACARELAKAGLRVTVVDERFTAAGVTSAAMGHIVVMDDSEAQFALTHYSRKLWAALEPELPSDVEYDRCGTIWVATDEEEMAEVRRKLDYYRARSVRAEILDRKALRAAEPNLSPSLVGGLLCPDDAVLYPPTAAAFLIREAGARGAACRFGARVSSIGNGSIRLADGTILAAAHVINAAGIAAPCLTPGLDIKPRKGHLLITDRYPGFLRHQLVELGYLKSAHSLKSDSVAFNVQPRKTGQLLVGSSRQYEVDSAEIDSSILARMLQRAEKFMPSLGSLEGIRAWTGFRPATPDKLPLIGPWPDDTSIHIAAGHEGLGITTSLATARLIADRILGHTSEISPEPYAPARQMAAVANRNQ